jgi:glycosyltransferase involved in cell wall biosynthesis
MVLLLMPAKATQVSLVISTLGRSLEMERLFESLVGQDHKDFEVIIVDQNSDDRLGLLCGKPWPFSVRRIPTPGERGLSRGRNVGWQAANSEIILFPDDDCWYPPWFLSRAIALLANSKTDVLTGRAADQDGNDINGRYSKTAHVIDRSNVWISGIEWVMLFKKSVLISVGGYSEDIGVGSATPWQACEGQDILLKALSAGFVCYFDPAIYGFHEKFESLPPDAMRTKGRAYARGLGYVLRVHNYGALATLWWIVRPIAKLLLSLVRGDLQKSAYFRNVCFGRIEGRIAKTFRLG